MDLSETEDNSRSQHLRPPLISCRTFSERRFISRSSSLCTTAALALTAITLIMLLISLQFSEPESHETSLGHQLIQVNGGNVLAVSGLSVYCTDGCIGSDTATLDIILELMGTTRGEAQQPHSSSTGKEKVPQNKLEIEKWLKEKQALSEIFTLRLKQTGYEREVELNVIKHERMTSSKKRGINLLEILSSWLWRSNYERIQRIFSMHNQQSWQSDGKYLTVFARSAISPRKFHIKVQAESWLMVFGLKIEQTVFTLEKRFTHILLGKFQLQTGLNELRCSLGQCQDQYLLISFAMDHIDLQSIAIFESYDM